MTRRAFVALGAAAIAGCTMQRGAAVRTESVWGGEGIRNGSFLRPRAIGVHAGEVYVIDMSGRVQVFSKYGSYLRYWEMPEHHNGTPTAIAFDAQRVVIPDTHYSRIIEYDREGKEQTRWGGYGSGEDQFIYPTGVVLGGDGSYFFSEYGQHAERVHVFDAGRKFARQWGGHGEGPGQFSRAMGIAMHSDGRLYVADTANHRVQVFSQAGELQFIFGNDKAKGPPLHYPHDIAVGPDDTFYLAEYGAHRISRYAADGSFIAAYGRAGRNPGEFNAPRGVAVDTDGAVFVADTDNHRIQAFAPGDAA